MNLIILPCKPLGTISPSRFMGLKQCMLREVWQSSRIEAPLPLSPSARLGTVIHCVLEKCLAGKIEDADGIINTWADEVKTAEEKMALQKMEQRFVPLSSSTWHFEVKKRQCIALAKSIVDEFAKLKHHTHTSYSKRQTELWLTSTDGQLCGQADYIRKTVEGDVIIDYKTGAVLEENMGGGVQVKEEYQLQLKLYAGLYEEINQKPPASLIIQTIDGNTIPIDFNILECRKLMAEARQLREKVNQIINSCNGNGREAILKLASPKPDICKLCQFRPACNSYVEMLFTGAADSWPTCDICGIVSDLKVLGNGKILLKLITSHDEAKYVRGLEANRVPEKIKVGTTATVFSAVLELPPDNFIEGISTVVFCQEGITENA